MLNEKEVRKRTDITLKMANVTGEAVEQVSSYMTAIWNNFADGTKNLEYFADVMTKLGADTASSSEEIAGGLEKFVAIGNQIGLSFEYAASVLATITAQTRQSEDVVGTSLRTIFSRIQGLTLGETLEDGTDLNKYSKALATVGIDIKDTNGELKDMDIILEEMGNKWSTLSKDTQVALAQAVAGVRQYNQLIALMDNWEFFQQNLMTAYTSEGTLTKQAEIYAQSWEAARNRVKAAAQGIYDALIDENVFIELDGYLESILNTVKNIIEGMGGMMPILSAIGGFITAKMAREAPAAINRMAQNIAVLRGTAEKEGLKLQEYAIKDADEKAARADFGSAEYVEYTNLVKIGEMRKKLLENQHSMNNAQIEQVEGLIQIQKQNAKITEEKAKQLDIEEAAMNREEQALIQDYANKAKEQTEREAQAKKAELSSLAAQIKAQEDTVGDLSTKVKKPSSLVSTGTPQYYETTKGSKKEIAEASAYLDELKAKYRQLEAEISGLDAGKSFRDASDEAKKYINELKQVERQLAFISDGGNAITVMAQNWGNNEKAIERARIELNAFLQNNLGQDFRTVVESFNNPELNSVLDTLFDESISDINVLKNNAIQLRDLLIGLEGQLSEQGKGLTKKLDDMGLSGAYDIAERAAINETQKSANAGTVEADTKAIDEILNAPKKLSEKVVAWTGFTMGANAATDAVGSFFQSLSDGASAQELFAQGLGTATTLAMSASNGIELYNSLLNSTQKSAVAAALATRTLGGTLKAVKIALTSNPVGWALVALPLVIKLVSWIIDLNKGVDEHQKKLDELTETANSLADIQEQVQQKVNDVNSAFNAYDTAISTLDDCTTGTEEWKNALNDVNQSILSILKIAPELSKYVRFDENGQAYFSSDFSQEDYLRQITREQSMVDAAAVYSQAELSDYNAQQNIYGDRATLNRMQEYFIGSNKTLVDAINEYKNPSESDSFGPQLPPQEELMRYLQGLYTNVFQEDIDKFISFLNQYSNGGLESGLGYLGNDAQKIRYLFDNEARQKFIEDSATEEGAYSYLSTYQDNIFRWFIDNIKQFEEQGDFTQSWAEAYDILSANDKNRRLAMSRFTSTIEGYSEEYANVYNNIVEDMVKEQAESLRKSSSQNDILSRYAEITNNEKPLSIKNGKLAEDGTETDITESAVYTVVAMADLANEAEILTEKFKTISSEINNMSDLAKSVMSQQSLIGENVIVVPKGQEPSRNKGTTTQDEVNNVLDFLFQDNEEAKKIYTDLDAETATRNLFDLYGKSLLSEVDYNEWSEKIEAASSEELNQLITLMVDNIFNSFDIQREGALIDWNKDISSRFLGISEELFNSFISIEGTTRGQLDNFSSLIKSLESDITSEDFAKIFDVSNELKDLGYSVADITNIFTIGKNEISNLERQISSSELSKALSEQGIETENLDALIEQIVITLNNATESLWNFNGSLDNLIGGVETVSDIINGISEGSTISVEDYEKIFKYLPEQYQKYFTRSGEEEMTFRGSNKIAEQLINETGANVVNSYLENFSQIQDLIKQNQIALSEEKITGDNSLESRLTFEGDKQATAALNTSSAIYKFLELAMPGSAGLEALKQGRNINNAETYDQGLIQAQEKLNALTTGEYNNLSTEIQQFLLENARTQEEINSLINRGIIQTEGPNAISSESLSGKEKELFYGEMEGFGLEGEEVDSLGDSIQGLAENSEYLADTLKDDAKAADDVAKSFIRFDRGVESINENYEDWLDLSKKTNRTIPETNQLAEEVSSSLEDLLDLSTDYFDLSNEKDLGFLTDPDTIKLMNQVASGVEGSEEKLINSLTDLRGQTLGLSNDVINAYKTMGQEMLNLPAGEEIVLGEGATVSDDFQNALNTIISSLYNANGELAGGVDQANEILSTMGEGAGFDIEAVTADTAVPGQTYYFPKIQYPNLFNMFNGGTFAPQVTWEKVEGGDTEFPNIAYKVTNKKGSYGGNVRKGSGKKGGGGGGGGGSQKPSGERKGATDKDRYRTVQNQLEDLTSAYDEVSTAADRAFGETKLKLLKQQEQAVQDLIAKQRDYIDEINRYYEIDRKAVEETSSRLGFEVEFDENGTITNWDRIQQKMIDEYNSHINAKGEVKDMTDEQWEEYEKEWERIMALYDQYDETQDLRKEALQQLQEYANELYDLQLQEVTYTVEIKVDATDDALEILDYMLGRIEDDAWAAAEAIAYMGDKASEIQLQNDAYTQGIQGILMNHTRDLVDAEGRVVKSASLTQEDVAGFMSGDQAAINKIMGLNHEFTDEEVQQLREYNSSLIEMNENLIELRETVYNRVLEAFNAFNDEMDESIDKIDHLSQLTENYANIVDIVGQKNLEISNALMESVGQAAVDQAVNRVEATRAKMLSIQEEVNRAEEALAKAKSAGLEEDVKLWEQNLKEMQSSLDDAEEDFMQSWEDALSSISEEFEKSIGRAVDTLSDSLAGPLLGSMDELEEMFDRQNTIADRYLPDYEKIYELNKLNRDITNSIDDTDNIKAKQELAALQEEINKLEEEGVQVSEYQVENLRRRYELKLAELALNEAQNAKSEVRMSRNADGDWSYVYVADEEQVVEAEQNYEDKLFAMQQANAEYINNLQDMIVQMEAEMAAKIEEIMNDETLSMEERMAKVQETTAFYQDQMGYYLDELGLVLGENQILYEEDWAKYSELTGYKISADEDYIDHFNETALSLLTGYDTMEQFQQNFNDAIGHPDTGGLLYDLNNAYETWKANTEAAFEAAGTTMSDYADLMEGEVNRIVDNSNDAVDAITELGDQAVNTFDEIISAVENWADLYSQKIDEILSKNELLAKSFNEVLKAWSGFEEAGRVEDTGETENQETDQAEKPQDSGQQDNQNKGIGILTLNHARMNVRQKPTSKSKDLGTVGSWSKVIKYNFSKKKGYWVYVDELGGWIYGNENGGKGGASTSIKSFDTGGYTGAWGSSEGRLALLHEKEAILNKDDTKNFLSAIELTRKIAEIIDLNAVSAMRFNNVNVPVIKNEEKEPRQTIINAEFPNATDRNEIIAAFDELALLASQRAGRI